MADARHSGIGMTSARTRERLVQRLMEQGIKDPRVLDRVRNVPRHLFMDEALASRAYEDTALPIGFGQTISQPFVVARMTEALHGSTATVLHNVLEIGTGCGYQTAVLSALVSRVSTVERMQPLLERAKVILKELGVKNVRFRHADGSLGWKAHAPYDGILVAAAAHAVPQALLEQLSPNGGRLVLPVGPDGAQELFRITRRDEHFVREKLGGVSFVPLVGGIG
jgi:protein-L-isoaspartate(D-aspartate) O-methyltransferase